MASPEISDLTSVCQIVEKIALELVLAEPGKDGGLLPVNCLLGDLESAVAAQPSAVPLQKALLVGKDLIDAVFNTGTFENGSLTHLRTWVEWVQSTLTALTTGDDLPAAPTELAGAGSPPASPVVSETSSTVPAAVPREDAIQLNLEGDGELLREFTNESQEHLQNIELGVLTLEENPTDDATLNSIFRAFHTFKGGSGFLNLRPINRLAHELESLLDLARQHKLEIDSQIINLILAGGDTLKRFVDEIEGQVGGRHACEPITISTDELLSRVRAVLDAHRDGAALASPQITILPPAAKPAAIAAAVEPPPASTPVQVAAERQPVSSESPAAASPAASAPPASNRNVSGASVKVDTQKLDGLVDLVGEMVIAQSMVMQNSDLQAIQSQKLSRNLAQLGRITKELQRVSMSLRMVPIRPTFQKMTRLVRDLGLKAGKQVELETSGEETELDRTIVEEISDPLIHMIRNAVDHGIEAAEKRLATGKSPHGIVRLRAFHKGGNIVIEVEDDGAGLNRDRIHQKAVEKGVIPPDALLSESDIYNLIFAPGFSTAEKVTDISGRGVGMDVVRRNIEKLRGKVEIQSTFGKGSRFTIYLPLTLAIIDGMIVGIGRQRYIVPTLAVRESFRPTPQMISSIQGRAEVVNVRGRLLPLLRLHELFGIEARATDPTQGIVIVVESDRDVQCVLVDELLGKQEVVIKSLGDSFKQSSALAGAAILGDGRVGLILDIEGLIGTRTGILAQAA